MSDASAFDTDVLIDVLRGQAKAIAFLKGRQGRLLISVLTLAELQSGVRAGRETEELQALLNLFETVPVDREIARLGGEFRRTFRKSHNLALVDALIAATAVRAGAAFFTLNRKHFPMLPDLIVPYAKP